MSEVGFYSIFPAGLFEVGLPPALPPVEGAPSSTSGQLAPAVTQGLPVWSQWKLQHPGGTFQEFEQEARQFLSGTHQGGIATADAGQQDTAGPGAPVPNPQTTQTTINYSFGLLLLLLAVVLGLWLLLRSQ